jgi:hypothetical protein
MDDGGIELPAASTTSTQYYSLKGRERYTRLMEPRFRDDRAQVLPPESPWVGGIAMLFASVSGTGDRICTGC